MFFFADWILGTELSGVALWSDAGGEREKLDRPGADVKAPHGFGHARGAPRAFDFARDEG
jgi:hypothetical protein